MLGAGTEGHCQWPVEGLPRGTPRVQMHVAFPSLAWYLALSLALNPAESLPPRVRHARAQEAPARFSDVSGSVGSSCLCKAGAHVPMSGGVGSPCLCKAGGRVPMSGGVGSPCLCKAGGRVPAANPVPPAHFAAPALPLPLGPAAGQAEALAIPHCLLQEKPRGTACKVVSWPRAPSRARAPRQAGAASAGGPCLLCTPPARRDAPAPMGGAPAAPPPGSWPGTRPGLWAQRVGEGGPEQERGARGWRAEWAVGRMEPAWSPGVWGSVGLRRGDSDPEVTEHCGDHTGVRSRCCLPRSW